MAKRFTDTNKYKKPFIRGLQGAYKVFWDYLYHDCDHAGIWIVDFEIAQLYIGKDLPVNKSDALKFFNSDEKRIIEIDGGYRWFIPSFISFQYGELNELNRAHNSVITILKKYNIYKNKTLISPLKGAKDKDMDKDKNLDKDLDKDLDISWRKNFDIYKAELRNEYNKLIADSEFISVQEKYHPNVDIKLSIEKACVNFWATEAGWIHKRKSRVNEINWKSTLTKAIDLNKVYKDRSAQTVNGETYYQMLDRVAKGETK